MGGFIVDDEDSGEAGKKERREAFIDPIDFEGDDLEDLVAAAAGEEEKQDPDDFFGDMQPIKIQRADESVDEEDEEERGLEEH